MGALVSATNCRGVSSTHTTGKRLSYGRLIDVGHSLHARREVSVALRRNFGRRSCRLPNSRGNRARTKALTTFSDRCDPLRVQ